MGGSFASTAFLEGVIHICADRTFIVPLHGCYITFCFCIGLCKLRGKARGEVQTCTSLNVGLSVLLRSVPSGSPYTAQMKIFSLLRRLCAVVWWHM